MAKFIILMYHSISSPVSDAEASFVCEPKQFDAHMRLLKSMGYYFASIDEIKQHMSGERELPERSILISFDDGYMDNYLQAYPILSRYKIPAVIFMVSGLIGKHNDWMLGGHWKKRKMLTWEQIKEMADNGIDFGCHTLSHPKLTEISNAEKKNEIVESKLILERGLGSEVRYLAYPFGLYDTASLEITRSKYLLAMSTHSGFNSIGVDQYALRRIEVNGRDSVRKLKQKVQFGINSPDYLTTFRYYLKQIIRRFNEY